MAQGRCARVNGPEVSQVLTADSWHVRALRLRNRAASPCAGFAGRLNALRLRLRVEFDVAGVAR